MLQSHLLQHTTIIKTLPCIIILSPSVIHQTAIRLLLHTPDSPCRTSKRVKSPKLIINGASRVHQTLTIAAVGTIGFTPAVRSAIVVLKFTHTSAEQP